MAYYEHANICICITLAIFLPRSSAEEDLNLLEINRKFETAFEAATETYSSFLMMFSQCVNSRMPHKQFIIDDMQKFVNYPSKTTVGLSAKFTGNRKFFANLISTLAFKDMLDKDTEEIWNDLIKKLKYCDEVVTDQELLREFYDRDVDPKL